MPLNFSIVEAFVSEYRERMHDRTVLRHERYRILAALRKKLLSALRDYERFEAELSSLVIESIEKAESYEELRRYHERAVGGIKNYFIEEQTVPDVHDLFRIVRDKITESVLRLVKGEMERDGLGPPPVPYAWIGLGSEGRDEGTFVTDQDNMLIYKERNGQPVVSYYEEFSRKAVEGLHAAGFNKCKGGIMPSNEKWRGSLEDWKRRIEESLLIARDSDLLDLIILTDARLMGGDRGLFDAFLGHFYGLLKENRHVMTELARSAVLMPTALGFFGKFKVETSGENKGRFNIKLFGWSPLVMSVRAYSLQEGLYETNTLRRIQRLRGANMISKDVERDLTDAYLLLVRQKIVNQIGAGEDGDANFVNPDLLGTEEAGKLRKAMRVVESFQKYVNEVLLFGQPG